MRQLWLAVILALVPGVAGAGLIQWTDWTSSDLATAQGSMGSVGVSFEGSLAFAQLALGSQVGVSGSNPSPTADYWFEGTPAPYTGNSVVDNRPPGYELLGFDGASTNVLMFSSPVVNPIMAIVSQGRVGVGVTYDFDTPFVVLSEGRGFWGDGSYVLGPGNTLTGYELHGVIQFQGTVSEIHWTSTSEFWHGITVGVEAVPEPGTLVLIGSGLLGLIARRRRAS